jgi:hypothetical protein
MNRISVIKRNYLKFYFVSLPDVSFQYDIWLKHAIYVKSNNKARWWNHFRSEKAISMKYSENVLAHLGTHYEICMRLSGSKIFFTHYLINGMIFEKK